MPVMGVDGTSRGWISVVLDGAGLTLLHGSALSELFRAAASPSVVAIDIPIELAENGYRQADLDARRFLGKRRSTIFFPAVRAVLDHGDSVDYATANRICRERSGKGLSRQSYALLGKIGEVDRWRRTVTATVHEAHPEVSFQVLAGAELLAGKKSWNGTWERWRLLADAGLAPAVDSDAGPATVDDVLDATVLAWTAHRIASGRAITFPANATARQPAIWA